MPLPPVEPAPAALCTLIARLEGSLEPGPNLLAFDGDGTLWSGDVSDEVFLAATRSEWLHARARDTLAELAHAHGLDPDGSSSRVAARLFEAHHAGIVAESVIFEAMAWCYAGHRPETVTDFAQRVLTEHGIEARLTRALLPVFEWARGHGIVSVLVTASPLPIVRIPARLWGFPDTHIIAASAHCEDGVIIPRLGGALPYGPAKATGVRAAFPAVSWLGSFGDSAFDFELLASARIRVAVNPKPSLMRRMSELGDVSLIVSEPIG
jgi:phosphatidylglycerophosphatase C